ncbi:MAG: nitrite/sulfite reductase [Candidatus Competibacterales bacterium]
MYRYDAVDRRLVQERVAQFRDQTRRYLVGELSEAAFRPLRLMNGLYFQRHAPMLRIAIPYGLLSTAQLRGLAAIASRYDRGYGHFTTRQNLQLNWPRVEDVPDILAALAEMDMHAIQTSGNCIRNVTTDPLAGVAEDELEDPRPYCEIIRQWSTFHPEFSYLPRKFKIAVTGASVDRAASQVHDIGLHLVRNGAGEVGFEVLVGGGLGRTPVIGKVLRPFLPKEHLLSYLEAILRIYNLMGRRDNKFKARIKILVNALGIDAFRRLVEAEWARLREGDLALLAADIAHMVAFFAPPAYDSTSAADDGAEARRRRDPLFNTWWRQNTLPHKVAGYRVVVVSLKAPGAPPGDMSSEQMLAVADLADRYSFGQVRTTHDQNMVLADVAEGDLFEVWRQLRAQHLATPNIGTLNDIICCPGLDYCSLANAGSIPIARQINERFTDLDYLYDLGDIQVKMSGCMNACGHHHVGHIGILGVDKKGEEWYQVSLGGSASERAALGKVLGPAVAKDRVAEAIARILDVYVEQRQPEEPFIHAVQRLGLAPFKERVYGTSH